MTSSWATFPPKKRKTCFQCQKSLERIQTGGYEDVGGFPCMFIFFSPHFYNNKKKENKKKNLGEHTVCTSTPPGGAGETQHERQTLYRAQTHKDKSGIALVVKCPLSTSSSPTRRAAEPAGNMWRRRSPGEVVGRHIEAKKRRRTPPQTVSELAMKTEIKGCLLKGKLHRSSTLFSPAFWLK